MWHRDRAWPVSPVRAQMWAGVGPVSGTDVAGVSPLPVQFWSTHLSMACIRANAYHVSPVPENTGAPSPSTHTHMETYACSMPCASCHMMQLRAVSSS